MASNLTQKNLIFNDETFNKIPFADVKKLDIYSETDAINNEIELNNTYNQMIQNDKFIKNEIIVKASESIGPKNADDNMIYDGTDGYKFWYMEDGDPYIYQKKDNPIKDSFVEITKYNLSFMEVIGTDQIIYSDSSKSYYSDQNFKDIVLNDLKFHEDIQKYQRSLEEDGDVIDIAFNCCSKSDEKVFSGSYKSKYALFKYEDDGLYYEELDSTGTVWEPKKDANGYVIGIGYYLKRLNVIEDEQITAVEYNNNTKRLVYATKSNVYLCDVGKSFEIKNKTAIHQLVDDEVVSIRFINEENDTAEKEILILTKNRCLYYSMKGTVFSSKFTKDIVKEAKFGFDINNQHYYCCSDGIYSYSTNTKIVDGYDFDLFSYDEKTVILRDESKGVYLFDGSALTNTNIDTSELGNIKGLFCLDEGLVGYITGNTIYYNRDKGIYGSYESQTIENTDDISGNVEKITIKNIDETIYVCFTYKDSDSKRHLVLVNITNDQSDIDTKVAAYDNKEIATLDMSDTSTFKQIVNIGSTKYLIYNDSTNSTIIRNLTLNTYERIFGVECFGFIVYEDIGYLISSKGMYIFNELTMDSYNHTGVAYPPGFTINEAIEYGSIEQSTYEDYQNCYIIIGYSSKNYFLQLAKTKLLLADSFDISHKDGSDIINNGGKLLQLDSDGKLSSFVLNRKSSDIDIYSSLTSIYSNHNIIDVSYAGYENKGSETYKLVTYINTDDNKCHYLDVKININDELDIQELTAQESPYKYAHIESINANIGLFQNASNTCYLRYYRFGDTSYYSSYDDDIDVGEKELNTLYDKYARNCDWLNSGNHNIISTEIETADGCIFINSKYGTDETVTGETGGTGVLSGEIVSTTCNFEDNIFVATHNSSTISVKKYTYTNSFRKTYGYSITETTDPDTGETNVDIELSSTAYTYLNTSQTFSVLGTVPYQTHYAVSNGKKTFVSESETIYIATGCDTTVSVYVDCVLQGSVDLDETILGISKYNEQGFIVITSSKITTISFTGSILKTEYFSKPSGFAVSGIFSLPDCEYDEPDGDIGEDYILSLQKTCNYTVFLDGNNYYDNIIEGNGGYLNVDKKYLFSPTNSDLNDTYIMLRKTNDNTALLISDAQTLGVFIDENGDLSSNTIAELASIKDIRSAEIDLNTDGTFEVTYPLLISQSSSTDWKERIQDEDDPTIFLDISINSSSSSELIDIIDSGDQKIQFLKDRKLYENVLPYKNNVIVETVSIFESMFDDPVCESLSLEPLQLILNNDGSEIYYVYKNDFNTLNTFIIAVNSEEEQVGFGGKTCDYIYVPNDLVNSDYQNLIFLCSKDVDNHELDIQVRIGSAFYQMTTISEFSNDTIIKYITYNPYAMLYYLTYSNGGKNRTIAFKSIGNDIIYLYNTRDGYDYDESYGDGVDIEKISDNNFLLVFKNQLLNYTFEMVDDDILDWEYKLISADTSFGKITKYSNNFNNYRLIGDGNQIKMSEDNILWTTQYAIGGNDNTISYTYIKNSKNIMCLKGSHLWYSHYSYYFENNTPKFTETCALAVFDTVQPDLQARIDAKIDNHIIDEHNSNKLISYINNFVSVKPDISSDFTTTKISQDEEFGINSINISGDYVQRILIGDSDDVLQVKTTNTATGNKVNNIDGVSYIAKCWNSGLVDLFINIPTTYTYYIPHIEYAGYCTIPNSVVTVNGKSLNANIRENYTTIELAVLTSYFNMDCIIENTIKGASLPLKIFKRSENEELEGDASKLFHSFIEPSIAQNVDIHSTEVEYERYALKYYCFGSDEQNVQLRFYDSKKNYLKNYQQIIYHGREGYTEDGENQFIQRILEDETDKPLYGEGLFISNTGKFIGWTMNKNEEENSDFTLSSISYNDSRVKFSNDKLNLYAVWLHYNFSDKDTIIEVDAHKDENYTIAEIEIAPNMEIEGYNLKNQVLIDWDSDTKA